MMRHMYKTERTERTPRSAGFRPANGPFWRTKHFNQQQRAQHCSLHMTSTRAMSSQGLAVIYFLFFLSLSTSLTAAKTFFTLMTEDDILTVDSDSGL